MSINVKTSGKSKKIQRILARSGKVSTLCRPRVDHACTLRNANRDQSFTKSGPQFFRVTICPDQVSTRGRPCRISCQPVCDHAAQSVGHIQTNTLPCLSRSQNTTTWGHVRAGPVKPPSKST